MRCRRRGRAGRAERSRTSVDAYLRANWATLTLAIVVALPFIVVALPFIVVPLWLVDWGSGVRGLLLGRRLR